MHIIIQSVQPDEIVQVKELLSHTWKDTYGAFLSSKTLESVTTHWHKPETLLQQSQMPDVYFPVAKDEKGKIVGLATFWNMGEGVVFMSRLYIEPGLQRQGIGSQLLDNGMKHFANIHTMRLEVEKQNNKGLAFYRKQGFVEQGTKREKVGNEEIEVLVMERVLSDLQLLHHHPR